MYENLRNSSNEWLLVPAHVKMMGLIGMGNNPMVGASVVVAISQA